MISSSQSPRGRAAGLPLGVIVTSLALFGSPGAQTEEREQRVPAFGRAVRASVSCRGWVEALVRIWDMADAD
jgi:hypothetical protein